MPRTKLLGVRALALEKGGLRARTAALPTKVIDPLPERAVADAELFGHVFLRTALDENGAECLVTLVIGMQRLAKEVPEKTVIHDFGSLRMLAIVGSDRGKW
jgi:hypothetical protein